MTKNKVYGVQPERLGGTPGYVSPEQAAAMNAVRLNQPIPTPIDGRSDVHSLGVVLFEALTGAPPPLPDGSANPAESSLAVARTLRRQARARVCSDLAEIVARCLSSDPADRYPDAASLAADLRRHLGYLPIQGIPRRGLIRRWLGGHWGRR